MGGAGTKLPVECWEFLPGNSTEEVEIQIHQSTETMHYWYPYANAFILSVENEIEPVQTNVEEVARKVSRLSPETK